MAVLVADAIPRNNNRKKDLTGLLEASQPSLFYSHICFTDIFFSDNLQMKKRRIAE